MKNGLKSTFFAFLLPIFMFQHATAVETSDCDKLLTSKINNTEKNMSRVKAKNGSEFEFLSLKANEVEKYLYEIAQFRIKYFKMFPYLYEGNMEYENHYIEGFANDPKALLILLKNGNEIIGVSTALPLQSNADILGDAPLKFKESGLDPNEFYYCGEVIIKPEYQGLGLTRIIFDYQEAYAKSLGYSNMTLSTVIREENNPLRPVNYIATDPVWERLGYKKQNIFIDYVWPTIQPDETVKEILNPMVFWTKRIN